MKNLNTIGLAIATVIIGLLVGCGQKSAVEKVEDQTAKVYALTADERGLAMINANAYYGKEWLPAGGKRGQTINCRPSDSNFNGLVSCNGFVPGSDGQFTETKMFCGYKPELVGCSNEDTVK